MTSLRAQADAVELAYLNKAGHVRILEGLVPKGRRPQHELDLARFQLPDLQAAAATLRQLADKE